MPNYGKPKPSLEGTKVGKLSFIRQAPDKLTIGSRIWRAKMVECVCDCGNTSILREDHYRKGTTKSCGCVWSENCIKTFTKHGKARSRIAHIYQGMMYRCLNPKSKSYPDYGGRGIVPCEKWMTLEGFLVDMEPTYQDGLTLERKDVNGSYNPENCEWATMSEQNLNKRNTRWVTFQGERIPLRTLCKREGFNYGTLWNKLYIDQIPEEEAFTSLLKLT